MAIYIALGANLPSKAGPPAATLVAALMRLAEAGVTIRRCSRHYRSPAWPRASDPAFVNAVAEIETDLPPFELMQLLHRVEAEYGRVRGKRNAPRTLDLDLLDYDRRIEGEGGGPTLPHPRLAGRAFVLKPLAEIAPDWRHPETGWHIDELIADLAENAVAEPLTG